mmetsp:Transcript_25221/g.47665  ORF Transcript_25221/g.47665 Transcript_25221/m.47665 type:complete len:201 (+) Transcript_25221:356-958(+)
MVSKVYKTALNCRLRGDPFVCAKEPQAGAVSLAQRVHLPAPFFGGRAHVHNVPIRCGGADRGVSQALLPVKSARVRKQTIQETITRANIHRLVPGTGAGSDAAHNISPSQVSPPLHARLRLDGVNKVVVASKHHQFLHHRRRGLNLIWCVPGPSQNARERIQSMQLIRVRADVHHSIHHGGPRSYLAPSFELPHFVPTNC